jgi:hypothetical protein
MRPNNGRDMARQAGSQGAAPTRRGAHDERDGATEQRARGHHRGQPIGPNHDPGMLANGNSYASTSLCAENRADGLRLIARENPMCVLLDLGLSD